MQDDRYVLVSKEDGFLLLDTITGALTKVDNS